MKNQTTAHRCFTVMWIAFAIFLSVAIGGEFLGDHLEARIGWLFTLIGWVSFLTAAVAMVATLFYWVARGQ